MARIQALIAALLFGIFCHTVVSARADDIQQTVEPTATSSGNRPPLVNAAYRRLPLGSVQPKGWLRDQLLTQKHGLTGHLDQFWLTDSVWKGGHSEETRDQLRGVAWRRAGKFMVKYLAGLMPLAHLLDDAELKGRSEVYMNWILDSGQSDGWFGQDRDFPGWNRNHLVEMNRCGAAQNRLAMLRMPSGSRAAKGSPKQAPIVRPQ